MLYKNDTNLTKGVLVKCLILFFGLLVVGCSEQNPVQTQPVINHTFSDTLTVFDTLATNDIENNDYSTIILIAPKMLSNVCRVINNGKTVSTLYNDMIDTINVPNKSKLTAHYIDEYDEEIIKSTIVNNDATWKIGE